MGERGAAGEEWHLGNDDAAATAVLVV